MDETKIFNMKSTNGTTFERDLNHKLKIGLDNDFIGYHLQRSGQQQMYRSNESIEGILVILDEKTFIDI